MRIKKMITTSEALILKKFSLSVQNEIYREQYGEYSYWCHAMRVWGIGILMVVRVSATSNFIFSFLYKVHHLHISPCLVKSKKHAPVPVECLNSWRNSFWYLLEQVRICVTLFQHKRSCINLKKSLLHRIITYRVFIKSSDSQKVIFTKPKCGKLG